MALTAENTQLKRELMSMKASYETKINELVQQQENEPDVEKYIRLRHEESLLHYHLFSVTRRLAPHRIPITNYELLT